MITNGTVLNEEPMLCDGQMKIQKEIYITSTEDLEDCESLAQGSKALNIETKELWIKRCDGKWQLYGATTVYPAE